MARSVLNLWLSPQPRAGIVRGLTVFLALFVARRTLSDSDFVLLAQVLAVGLVVGMVATARTRGARVGHLLASFDQDSPDATNPDPRVVSAMTVVGLMAGLTLVFAPTLLAYNSRPDDMVAALFFAAAFYRAPHQVAQSLAPQFVSAANDRNWFSIPMIWLAPIGLIAALFAAGFAALVGPWLFDFLVGDGDVLRRPTHSGIAATTTVASINLMGSLALANRSKFSAIALIWVIPGLIVAYPISNATEAGPLVQMLELYVAMVYLGQLWVWSRRGPQVPVASRASLQQ